MSNALRDFIAKRRAELRKEIDARMEELSELEAAERAIFSGPMTYAPPSPHARLSMQGPKREGRTHTIQEMALNVLADCPEGADALKIIELIKEKFHITVPRTSMSPQLSRLKVNGDILLDDKTWRLPPKEGPDNEAPDDCSSGASGGESSISPSFGSRITHKRLFD